MARLLPSVGTVSYNGFTFPAPFEAEVSAQPRRDSANRSIKYVTYSITIRCVIVPDDAPTSTAGALVDDNLENIRCRLTKAGGSLKFIGQGLGTDFVVNSIATYTDPSSSASVNSYKVAPDFGPFPTLLAWKPVGSNRAAEIVWTCEVTLPECCGSDSLLKVQNNLYEHTFSTSWDVSDQGVSARIIQGRYEVAGFRQGATVGLTGTLLDSQPFRTADQIWDGIYSTLPVIPGFKRDQRRSMSADKRTMEYTITDTEIPSDNPFFPYMVNMNVSHSVDADFPIAIANNSISGSITIAPGAPRQFAWIAFRKIVSQRFSRPVGVILDVKGQKDQVQRTYYPIPRNIRFDEDLYGRTFSFGFTWFFATNLQTIFRSTGLFTAIEANTLDDVGGIPGGVSDWLTWTASMQQVVYSARSLAKLRFLPNQDIILSACDAAQPLPQQDAFAVKNIAGNLVNLLAEAAQEPPKANSFVSYSQRMEVVQTSNTVRHNVVKDVPQTSAQSGSPGADNGYQVDNTFNENQQDTGLHTTQVRGPSTAILRIKGSAVRVGYKVPIPKVTSVGGTTPVVRGVTAAQEVIGKSLWGTPIYAAKWSIDLILPSVPTGDLMSNITTDGLPEQHV